MKCAEEDSSFYVVSGGQGFVRPSLSKATTVK
jgi:hypothetical protein